MQLDPIFNITIESMTENEIEYEIITWLRARNWICRRQQSGVFFTADGRRMKIGENGECDWRCMRPLPRIRKPQVLPTSDGRVEYLELEAKSTNGKPSENQRAYIAKRTEQGVAVIVADSMEKFRWEYYRWFRDDTP